MIPIWHEDSGTCSIIHTVSLGPTGRSMVCERLVNVMNNYSASAPNTGVINQPASSLTPTTQQSAANGYLFSSMALLTSYLFLKIAVTTMTPVSLAGHLDPPLTLSLLFLRPTPMHHILEILFFQCPATGFFIYLLVS